MISGEEIRDRAAAHGVPENQIQRDHLISHVLFALSKVDLPQLTFFGGTALCRSWSADTRLSEDVDLLVEDHIEASERIPALIARGIRREYPSVQWIDMGRRHEVDTRLLDVGAQVTLRIQFTKWRPEWRGLPIARTPVRLRYSDLPNVADLRVPTPQAFVVMKLLAWGDRQAPRDLFDLHDLARSGHFTPPVREMVRDIAGCPPESLLSRHSIPAGVENAWGAELGHQLSELPSPKLCLKTVWRALDDLSPD